MLNIISKSINSDFTSGPQKVVKNLVKGLDILGYPYVINKSLDSCARLWIHDDIDALREIKNLDPEIKVVVGPNLFVLPRNIPDDIDLSRAIYIHPSPWAKDFWVDFGFDRCPLDYWPTGIDMAALRPSAERKEKVLIYFKQRFPEELDFVKGLLKDKQIPFETVVYRHYKQSDYISALKTAKYMIWVGRQESQGIALEEALAMNVPVLVWDIDRFGHWLASEKEMAAFNEKENDYRNATAAYYFDDRCGIKIKNKQDLPGGIDSMEKRWQEFSPRQYILENLNLEKQARDLLKLYEKHYGLIYEAGLEEKPLNDKAWKNSRPHLILYTKLKDFIKKLLR